MSSMSMTLEVESKTGGLGKVFGRLLTGESVFQTYFLAKHGPGEILLSPKAPGDIIVTTPSAVGLMVTSGCFLCCHPDLQIDVKTEWRGLFGGEGMFFLRASGGYQIALTAFGAVREIVLQPGEGYIVDTGHIVAFDETVGFSVKRAAKTLLGSFTSGEGFVCHLTGPGRVWMQTHTPQGLAQAVAALLPRS